MAFALSLTIPAVALGAAEAPTVTTGGVAKLTPSTVSLLGKIDPNDADTLYLFQYGPTTLYGAQTAAVAVSGPTNSANVVVDVGGLAPATTYHYRLVATNSKGTRRGSDRTFKTRAQPLGLSLGANPNPVQFGKPTVLGGVLTGTGNANRQVVLQSNPFPYVQGFVNTTNILLTGAGGEFSFPLVSVALNTQYRVLIPTKPEISSPIVFVSVTPRISTSVTATRVRPGQRVRFSGTVHPGQGGERLAIQKLKGTRWVTLGGSITHRVSSTFSRYSKRIRIRHSGSYRVYIAVGDGRFASSAGRTVRIRLR
ncbi:MAG: hypothetical protein QOG94_1358 [Solirubrobacteraceae bacterium]|nr:hypothetical protein [Solirubrobacteraceae bacterium]